MGTPTVYVTSNSYRPYNETTGAPETFGSTHTVGALEAGVLTTLWTAALTGPAGAMLLSPDLSTLYVSEANLASGSSDPARPNTTVGNRVYLVDTAAHMQTGTWTLPCLQIGTKYVGAPVLSSILFSPDGSQLWVSYTAVNSGYPSGAPSESLTSSQAFIGSIEAFDAVTRTHIGPLVRVFAQDINHLGGPSPFIEYTDNSVSGTKILTRPISPRLALSPDGATLYVTGAIPDLIPPPYSFYPGGTYTYIPVVLAYPISLTPGPPPSYSLGAPAVLNCGNAPLRNGSTYTSQAWGQIIPSADGGRLYVQSRFGNGFVAVDAATGDVVGKSLGGGVWGAFAYDPDAAAPRLYEAQYADTSDGNKIRSVNAADLAAPPGLVSTGGNILFSMGAYGGAFYATSPLLATSSSGGSITTNTSVVKMSSGGSVSYVTLPGVPWCILCSSGGGTGGGDTSGAAGMQVSWDAHRQPRAVSGGTGIQFLASADNGHTFAAFTACASGKDPSLLISPRSNLIRVVFDNTGLSVVDAAQDGERSDWGTPAAITGGVSGTFPACAKHPTDPARVLMAYLDGGTLKTAISYDGGAPGSWSALGTVDSSLDFKSSGRAGLCWLGETPLAVYASGGNLLARTSADGGKTWDAAVTVDSSGPYHGVSAASGQGTVVVCASDASAPHLWTSPDLGATWATGNAPPAPTGPAALALDPRSGRLWYGTALKSDNWGVTWEAP